MRLGEVTKHPKGFRIAGIYQVARFEVKTAKNGKAYGDCVVSDPSFEIPAKYWDIPAESAALFQQNSILGLEATLDYFKESPQLTIDRVYVPSPQEIDQSLQRLGLMAPRDIDGMYKQLEDIIAGVCHNRLRQMLVWIFLSNTSFAEQFKRHPGAVRNHHAYIGGLLQHTLEVAEAALDQCARNGRINKDLLLASALVHDIGKVREIEVDTLGLPVGFTKEGKLLRHISLGMELVGQACREVQVEEEVEVILKHCILSHHGQAEWGSPVAPMLLEAELLHYLDNLSAKTEQFAREQERLEPGDFTKSYVLRREVYRTSFAGD